MATERLDAGDVVRIEERFCGGVEGGDRAGDGPHTILDAIGAGSGDQVGEPTLGGEPAHHQHPVDDGSVLDHVGRSQVHRRRHAAVELEFVVDGGESTLGRREVEERRADRFEELEGSIPGEEHRRDVGLGHRGRMRRDPTRSRHARTDRIARKCSAAAAIVKECQTSW